MGKIGQAQALRAMKRLTGDPRAVRCVRRDGACVVEFRQTIRDRARGVMFRWFEAARAETWERACLQARTAFDAL